MEQRRVTFGAVGDINLVRPGDESMRRPRKGGAAWPFEKMRGLLREADLLFGNMESVILPPDYPKQEIDPKGLVSRYDSSAALKEAGFDIVNLAQNHILDAGARGMFHTQQVIEAAGLMSLVRNTLQIARIAVVFGGAAIRHEMSLVFESDLRTAAQDERQRHVHHIAV